jgi:flagellar assembly protein FliH
MTTTPRVYSSDRDARVHVFEPLAALTERAGANMDAVEGANREAESEIEGIRKAAYAAGVEAGRQAAHEHYAEALQAMAGAAEQFQTQLSAVRESLKHQTLGLSLAIARQIAMSELQSRPEAIGDILEQLLADLEGRKVFAVRMHPDDAELIKTLPVAKVLEETHVQVRSDDGITRGGCAIETGFGRLDAQVETRIAEMSAALLGTADGPPGAELEAPLDGVRDRPTDSEATPG